VADTLHTLARIRRLHADLARRDLGQAVQVEIMAQNALQAAVEAPAREIALLATGHRGTETAAFAAWLPLAQSAIVRRTADAQAASQARDATAQALASAKSALEAVETLQAQHARAARKVAQRKAQSGLDELGGRCRPTGG
jgi:flagellar biosynthesis chaperone FliJ